MSDKQALFKVIKEIQLLSEEKRGVGSESEDFGESVGNVTGEMYDSFNDDSEFGSTGLSGLADPVEEEELKEYVAAVEGQRGVDGAVQLVDLDGDADEDGFLDTELDTQVFSDAFMDITARKEIDMIENKMIAKGYIGEEDMSARHGLIPSGSLKGRSVMDIGDITDPPRIRVIVRKRPLNSKELERGEEDVLQCDSEQSVITVHEPRAKVDLTKYTETHSFKFDDVFDTDVDNDALYARTVRPLIAILFKHGRGTCFAYGQTGSGKTYTMQPLPLRAASDIFEIMKSVPEFQGASLHVSCYEIYGGKVFDLLNDRQRLEVREDAKRRVQVVGLKEIMVSDLQGLSKLCDHAACSRSTGSTGANDESSRSHSIMTFAIRVPRPSDAKTKVSRPGIRIGKENSKESMLKTVGKLSFIDLAGSERGADTYDNDKQTRLEGAEINKSLLALKECIRALDMDAGHVPFRGSKLTSVLRDSFVGKNARTVMIANVSPSSNSCEHTLNTLRYADRVKEMKKDTNVTKGPQKETSSSPDMVSRMLAKLPTPEVPASCPLQSTVPRLQMDALVANGRDVQKVPRSARLSMAPVSARHQSTRSDPRITTAETSTPRMQRKSILTDTSHGVQASSESGQGSKPPPSARAPPIAFIKRTDVAGEDLDTRDAALDEIEAAEEDLTFAHRQHIEAMMSGLREEMDLLAKTDNTLDESITMEDYVEELGNILIDRAAAIAALQQQVSAFKRRVRQLT